MSKEDASGRKVSVFNYTVMGALVGSLVLVSACGSDAAPAEPDANDVPIPLLEAPPADKGVQLGLDVHIAAGAEAEWCQYMVLPGSGRVEISKFEHKYSDGSHHMLLYQTNLSADDVSFDKFACAGASFTALGVRGIAYGAQVPEGDLDYPDGVALPLQGGEVVLLNAHYLNVSDKDLDAEVRLNLWYMDEPATIEASTLFFYDWAILVPKDGPAQARMRCRIPEDINLIFGQSHMHRRGVGYGAYLSGGDLVEDVPLYETTRWEDVEPTRYNPMQKVSAGQFIDFHCDYQGNGIKPIVEGPSADDNEMCMFIASYYPKLDFNTEICAGPESGPVFNGTATCTQSVICMVTATDEVSAEECVFKTCADSAPQLSALTGCIFNKCATECDGGDACEACINKSCAAEYDACGDATCQ